MPYKRSEDQYQISEASRMIEQLKEESKKRQCTFSTVRMYKKLDFSGHPHVGQLVHSCILVKDHKEECTCACGMEFLGF